MRELLDLRHPALAGAALGRLAIEIVRAPMTVRVVRRAACPAVVVP